MATYYIYCPCSVHKIGVARVSHGPDGKSLFPYVLFGDIHDGHKRAACRHCGDTVRILGADKRRDRSAGITRRTAKAMIRVELAAAAEGGGEHE